MLLCHPTQYCLALALLTSADSLCKGLLSVDINIWDYSWWLDFNIIVINKFWQKIFKTRALKVITQTTSLLCTSMMWLCYLYSSRRLRALLYCPLTPPADSHVVLLLDCCCKRTHSGNTTSCRRCEKNKSRKTTDWHCNLTGKWLFSISCEAVTVNISMFWLKKQNKHAATIQCNPDIYLVYIILQQCAAGQYDLSQHCLEVKKCVRLHQKYRRHRTII